jgi:hypothetical protein
MVSSENLVSYCRVSLTLNSYEQFRDIANVTDMDSPYQTAGTSFSETATRSTARRLRRTRQHLGSYRHDLLVAMRVVNNVEREMLKAEWENWLLDENTRCKQVQMMLRENRGSISPNRRIKGADSQQVLDAKERERSGKMDDLRKWQEEYCGSCKVEQERLLDGQKNLTFG